MDVILENAKTAITRGGDSRASTMAGNVASLNKVMLPD